jgi:hypothetical protein
VSKKLSLKIVGHPKSSVWVDMAVKTALWIAYTNQKELKFVNDYYF